MDKLEWMPSSHAHMKTLDWKSSVEAWVDGDKLLGFHVQGHDDHEGEPTYITVSPLPLCNGQMVNFDSRPAGDTGENVVEYITYIFADGKLVEM